MRTEKDSYLKGYSVNWYQEQLVAAAQDIERDRLLRHRQVVKAEDMPWEDSPHGRMKHLIHPKMDYPVRTINLYLMVLPPGGRSGKHRHMAEELLYIIDGSGYDMHWDPDVEISDRYYWRNKTESARYEWAKGDYVYIPPMVAHQHFNAQANGEARFLACSNRVYGFVGYPEVEQIENAPEYRGHK